MANYNSGKLYNYKCMDGGAMYNSAPYVVVILENGYGIDAVDSVLANISVSDIGAGNDIVGVARAVFFVDEDGYLQPLGVLVTNDSRYEMIPETRDYSEEIPGRHGEIDFGTEFKTRALELHVAVDEDLTALEKSQLQRLFAYYLDPTKGAKELIFSDDIEKTYVVKYSGKIQPTNYPSWFDFTIPFKMSDPLIIGSFEKELVGSGTIVNGGTFETPILIEIPGPATNPSISVGTSVISYASTVASGRSLIIDTDAQTAYISAAATTSINATASISGYIDYQLAPMVSVAVVPSTSGTVVTYKDRWL